ncbi:hypothetical protein Peur_048886 [Populus x canadensis]
MYCIRGILRFIGKRKARTPLLHLKDEWGKRSGNGDSGGVSGWRIDALPSWEDKGASSVGVTPRLPVGRLGGLSRTCGAVGWRDIPNNGDCISNLRDSCDTNNAGE